jgi:hypothetical protein
MSRSSETRGDQLSGASWVPLVGGSRRNDAVLTRLELPVMPMSGEAFMPAMCPPGPPFRARLAGRRGRGHSVETGLVALEVHPGIHAAGDHRYGDAA